MAVLCTPQETAVMERRGRATRIRISTRFMTSEVQSWSEVIGHLAFHWVVATTWSAISTKNIDYFSLAENTWPVCEVGLGLRCPNGEQNNKQAPHVSVTTPGRCLSRRSIFAQESTLTRTGKYSSSSLTRFFRRVFLYVRSGIVTVVAPCGWIVFKLRWIHMLSLPLSSEVLHFTTHRGMAMWKWWESW